MKILVVSDTHGNTEGIKDILRDTKDRISALIHAGDYESDADEIQRLYPDLPVYGVCGNCDFSRLMPPLRMIELRGKRIFITHGHRYEVNYSLTKLAYTALENQADICIFGHTHVPLIEEYEGVHILNPGSLSRPRGGSKASYGVITIENDTIDIKIVEYKR